MDRSALLEAVASIPYLPLEEQGTRIALSPKELAVRPFFWTVESAFFKSAEALLKEVPTSSAISKLSQGFGADAFQMPPGPFLSSLPYEPVLEALPFNEREVARIIVHKAQRRVDMRWKPAGDNLWLSQPLFGPSPVGDLAMRFYEMRVGRRRAYSEVLVPRGKVEVEGLNRETAVVNRRQVFVIPGTQYAHFLASRLIEVEKSPGPHIIATCVIALMALLRGVRIADATEYIREQTASIQQISRYGYLDMASVPDLAEALNSTDFATFDPSAWSRRGGETE